MSKVWPLAGWSLGMLGWATWRQIDLARSRPLRVAHEAGHALLNWQSPYTARILKVSVVPDFMGYEGVVESLRLVSGRSAFHNAVCCMGGIAGEMVALGRALPAGSRGDFRNARACFEGYAAEEDIPGLLDHTLSVARQQIAGSLPAYRKLCRALDRYDTLTGAQLDAVLGPRPPTVFSRSCREALPASTPASRGRLSGQRPL
jgi:hypothetical protein